MFWTVYITLMVLLDYLGLGRIWIFGRIPDNPANELPDMDIRPDIRWWPDTGYPVLKKPDTGYPEIREKSISGHRITGPTLLKTYLSREDNLTLNTIAA